MAGLHEGENVSLVSTTAPGGGLGGAQSGDTIGLATAGADGRATLVIPAPLAHGEGRFEIDGVGTSAPLPYSGGDTYVLERTGSQGDGKEEPWTLPSSKMALITSISCPSSSHSMRAWSRSSIAARGSWSRDESTPS